MKIVQINTTCGIGSTGKLCVAISKLLTARKIENYIFYTQGNSDYPLGIKYSNEKYKKIQALKSRIFGNGGFNSKSATKRLIKELDRISPDIIHIHNIHGHDCDLNMLVTYLKNKQIKLFWTFHDCWTFTGNCPYFTMAKCEKWRTACGNCPQIRQTSWFFDRSKTLFERKRALFNGLDMTVITPSEWLAGIVRQSFFASYAIKVINNGIDLEMFRPTESDFKSKYGCENKKIILGVAFNWEKRKGIDVFIKLSKRFSSDYQVVLVGTDKNVDKILPKSIISVHRTQSPKELAEIYTAADVFVNPTREEVFGLVNVEANACGTPVITFDTGGSPECICENSGSVVPCDDINALESEIYRVLNSEAFSKDECVKRAKFFDMNIQFGKYVDLYTVFSE